MKWTKITIDWYGGNSLAISVDGVALATIYVPETSIARLPSKIVALVAGLL